MTRYTAVVDRIEEGSTEGERLAALVLEGEGRAVDELVVPVEQLPADARRTDVVLSVVVEDGRLVEAIVEEGAGDARIDRNRRRLGRLSRRLPRAGEDDNNNSKGDDCDDSNGDDGDGSSWPRHQ